MTPEQWGEIEKLYEQALRLEPGLRAAFLKEACVNNEEQRKEIESLLTSKEQIEKEGEQFLESSASEDIAKILAANQSKRLKQDPLGLVGKNLTDRLYIEDYVGRGGMGVVYKAYDSILARHVAIKFFQPSIQVDHDYAFQQFVQEIKTTSSLHHKNIVIIYDAKYDDGLVYMVMEWLEGPTLEEELFLHGRLGIKRIAHILQQIVAAIKYAHTVHHITHRDLKPANIKLIRVPGEPELVKVLDFGLAKAWSDTAVSRITAPLGTPSYASPEQFRTDAVIDGRSDIYSLGIIIYQMLTGDLPFDGSIQELISQHRTSPPPSIRKVRPDVPVEIEQLIMRMLAKEPDQRPQRAEEIIMVFERAIKSSSSEVARNPSIDGEPTLFHTPPGFFSGIDSIHVHVDGGGKLEPVEHIIEQLKKQKAPGKINRIKRAVSGPQREDNRYIGTYENHTPGPVGQEMLEFFSTTLLSADLQNMRGTIQKLNHILSMLFEEQTNMPSGIVVEVERVVAKGEEKIEWSEVPINESLVIHSPDAGFERRRTMEIEIHYAFDIPKKDKWRDRAPFGLPELKKACLELGIGFGGWFFFEDFDNWSYRSNKFAAINIDVERIVQEERDKLDRYLSRLGKELGFECKVRALVEQILGLWKTPLRPTDTELRKSVRHLAEWEASRNIQEFWVIAPNFLGDTRGEVRQAMIHNLRNRVKYTYFLRSFADVQRLRKLAESLEPDVRGVANTFNLIKAILLESIPGVGQDIFEEEFFIANPNSKNREGYRLLRTNRGEIYEGEKMSPSDFRNVDLFASLIKQNRIAHWMQIPLQHYVEKPKQRAIVCAKLNKALTEQDWETVINEFDHIVADNVSKLGGHTIKGSITSCFIIFEDTEQALRCAKQLQENVRDYNRHVNLVRIPPPRLALDYGHTRRVMRSYGFDFVGHPISVCAKLVKQMQDEEILLTKTVADNLDPTVRSQFKFGNSSLEDIEEFGNIECCKLDWK